MNYRSALATTRGAISDSYEAVADAVESAAQSAAEVPPAQCARALGWTSLAVGLTELAATRQLAEVMGLDDTPQNRGILRVLGVREVMHGVGILTKTRNNQAMRTGVWSRVLGDALDGALLGVAATKTKRPGAFAAVAAMVAGIGLADVVTALRLQKRGGRGW